MPLLILKMPLLTCLRKFNLNSIVHRYLEKGHIQNEGDTIHASIEHASRNIQVYTTDHWATLISTACHKNLYTSNDPEGLS